MAKKKQEQKSKEIKLDDMEEDMVQVRKSYADLNQVHGQLKAEEIVCHFFEFEYSCR